MTRPQIVIDAAVTAGEEVFSAFGSVRALRGEAIAGTDLRQVDALVVRTVTRIDRALVGRAPRLRFLGSASAGFDHVDRAALAERGIRFGHAPGCNAMAVAQWVIAALCRRDPSFLSGGRSVGIVGVGEVGSRLAATLARVGHRVMRCDPPRARRGDPGPWFGIESVCAEADIVTLHVPLTPGGVDRSAGLIDPRRLSALLARGGTLVNASRGAVLHPGVWDALPRRGQLILDVFEGEPELPWTELGRGNSRVDLASPHVAGYSRRAKLRATSGVADALSEVFAPGAAVGIPAVAPTPYTIQPGEGLGEFLVRVSGIEGQDTRLRSLARSKTEDRAAAYRRLRAEFDLRPQWCDVAVDGATVQQRDGLARLGFRLFA